MKRDNLDVIIPFLEFKSPDDFYYIQILQRKKENPQLGSNSRVIKNYYIKSIDYLERVYPEIKDLCDMFNARAMIRLNKRSFEKVAFKTMVNIANSSCNREYEFVRKSYDRAVGQGHNDKIKKWILDVDGKYTDADIERLRAYIDDCEPITKRSKILALIPSKNGCHVITTPFNQGAIREKLVKSSSRQRKAFTEVFPDIEIQKDNPTNLYIP